MASIYMAASFVGNAELVRQLIDAGARTEPQDRMHAAGLGHGNAIQVLPERGARSDLRDDRGMTAIEIARKNGHGEIAEAAGLH